MSPTPPLAPDPLDPEVALGTSYHEVKTWEDTNPTLPNLTEYSLSRLFWLCHMDHRGKRVNPHLKPYLDAGMEISTTATLDTLYYQEPMGYIIPYFLNNATTWKGPVARAVKRELNYRQKSWAPR